MTSTQLRQALRELNGERHLAVVFAGIPASAASPSWPAVMDVNTAMLIPDEDDHLVKVTDGKSVFILDAERVAWIRIGLK